jgi:hypothetical protein
MAKDNKAGVVENATPVKTKLVKVEALINLQGKYKLAWSAGQVFEIDSKQAKELEEVQAIKILK